MRPSLRNQMPPTLRREALKNGSLISVSENQQKRKREIVVATVGNERDSAVLMWTGRDEFRCDDHGFSRVVQSVTLPRIGGAIATARPCALNAMFVVAAQSRPQCEAGREC